MDHHMHHMDNMDHGGGHGGGHEGHGGMEMCNMNMLFTWDTTNLCIVFKEWRVTGLWSLIFSIIGVIALSAGYEFVRCLARRYEARIDARLHQQPTNEASSLLPNSPGRNNVPAARDAQVTKALFYAAQVFYSFFIMLLFMTYNGWVMLAVAAGSFVGYLIWGTGSATKDASCH